MRGKGKAKVIQITPELKHLYTDYCRAHRYDHDESDLCDENLLYFDPEVKIQPTFALVGDKQKVIGMLSVRLMPYMADRVRGRLAIFHTLSDAISEYSLLLEAIKPYLVGVDHLYGFMPEKKAIMAEIMPKLHFEIERYVWVLIRPERPVAPYEVPEGMSLSHFVLNRDEAEWCLVRNEAFQTLKGSETPMTEAQVTEMCQTAGHLPEGMLILRENDLPIGVVRVAREEEEGQVYGFIGPVAVKPTHQGKGLGRMLLRASLEQSERLGFKQAMLCVNAENARAADLYINEGFEKAVVMTCYRLSL